jgi:hypothetical protein
MWYVNSRVTNADVNPEVGLVVNWGCHELNHWPVAEYKFLVRAFIDEYNPVVIPTQKEYDRWKADLEYVLTIEPSSYMAPAVSFDTASEQTIALITGHPHSKGDEFVEYISNNDVDYVLSRYNQPMSHYFSEVLEGRLVHFPWAVPKEFVAPREEIVHHSHPDIKIFGKAASHPMYETRRELRTSKFVDNIQNISNSRNKSKPLTDEEYYRWIRNFDAAIAAGSFQPQYQYTFAKYFEIPAAGCLLFAQYCEDLAALGFDDNNCVIFESIADFEEKAESYIHNSESFLEHRQNGAELIRQRHTISNRIETIDQLFS